MRNMKWSWRKPVIKGLIKHATHIHAFYAEYKSYQYLLREKILLIQQKKLKNILSHAYHHAPYYRALLSRHDILQNNTIDINKFYRLPPLTKEIIREQGDALYSSDRRVRHAYINTSGGSTGEPILIMQDRHYKNASIANKLIYNEMAGKHIGEKEIKLWGSEKDISAEQNEIDTHIINWLYNRVTLNSFSMNEKQMKQYIETINTVKPKIIWAYVDSLYELARYAEKNKRTIYSPHIILTTAGTLYSFQRELIERVFKCLVLNQYGSREVGSIATECPYQQGLHAFEYLYYIEILNDQLKPTAPNEIGEIYITSLINYSMPLIRYKIGDRASWSDIDRCPCGRNLRLIQHIHGRVTDHFKKFDGTLIHGEYFTHLLYFRPWIKKFQIIQTNYNTIMCHIVKNKTEEKKDIEDITHRIQKIMGEKCTVSFVYHEEIPPTPSGKYRYTMSSVT